ncbi:glycosyltransferase family 2 protein [Sneathiella sp. P13V-1]|uniref:glycosyltransferase family A protein n=1 Tax=Sneathiella sp. P13V-1 TaxID=2697366 RepID=UPI00187B3A94|nr:glycosyltransferase family A protein [Sneathiella sp. P13V-1]MBE7635981.1 glycosyltransferase family 2 protein [Sneathiella sp. P13V-1]
MNFRNSQKIDAPFDAAVVIPTIVRPELVRAMESLFRQDLKGTIQVLIGVDKCLGDESILDDILKAAPKKVTVSIVDPGYSTSTRHTGVHSARDGGSLRTVMSFLANSQYVSYLDDDNYVAPEHISSQLRAIKGVDWTCSLRWLVDEETDELLTIDKWHSVGIGTTTLQNHKGGFADPNTIMVDKLSCAPLLHTWSKEYFSKEGMAGADRRFSDSLIRNRSHRPTGRATTFYFLRPNSVLWKHIRAEKAKAAQSA